MADGVCAVWATGCNIVTRVFKCLCAMRLSGAETIYSADFYFREVGGKNNEYNIIIIGYSTKYNMLKKLVRKKLFI